MADRKSIPSYALRGEYRRRYIAKCPWVRKSKSIASRCYTIGRSYNKRGIKNFLSVADLKYLWFRDKAFDMDVPSIDRINPKENYTLDNCRFIENRMNNVLSKAKLKVSDIQSILSMREGGSSIKEIATIYNVNIQSIYNVLNGRTWDIITNIKFKPKKPVCIPNIK